MKFPLKYKKTVYAIAFQTGLCLAGSGLFYPLSAIAEEPAAGQPTVHVKPRLFVLTDMGCNQRSPLPAALTIAMVL